MPPTLPVFTKQDNTQHHKKSQTTRVIAPLPAPAQTPRHLTLSHSANQNLALALKSSWSPSTINDYRETVSDFLAFCNKENVPKEHRTPTPEPLLCAFAAEGLGELSSAAANRKMEALEAWHIYRDWPWHGGARLKQVLRGVEVLAPKRTSPPPSRSHVTIAALETLFRYLDTKNPSDLAIVACACTAFWGQCRLDELIPNSIPELATSGPYPTRSDIRGTSNNAISWLLHLPPTRTNRRGPGITLLKQAKEKTNPLAILTKFLKATSSPLPKSSPLFSYYSNNQIVVLTKQKFLERCNAIWSRTGHARCTSGDSFRIGGTTHLLASKFSPETVKMMGRWSSNSFDQYWQSLEVDDIALITEVHMSEPVRK